MKSESTEIEIPAVEIDARTEEPEPRSNLKKLLIKLLADPEVREQLYNAIKTEDALRESRARMY